MCSARLNLLSKTISSLIRSTSGRSFRSIHLQYRPFDTFYLFCIPSCSQMLTILSPKHRSFQDLVVIVLMNTTLATTEFLIFLQRVLWVLMSAILGSYVSSICFSLIEHFLQTTISYSFLRNYRCHCCAMIGTPPIFYGNM